MTAIADAFLNIRADHLASDALFSQFIVPPFFKRKSIFADRRSVRILGGRGCGKTMFLRYFNHGSSLNPIREEIPESELESIGLYLRPDTGFCGLMTAPWLGEQRAKLAFSHYVALNLLVDACRAVSSINQANFALGRLNLGDPGLSAALAHQLRLKEPKVSALEAELEMRLVELEDWVRNPKANAEPTLVSFASVLPRLAGDLAKAHPRMARVGFRAFIDEFENLPGAHREVICDAIKHPSLQMAVHIAYKKHAVIDLKTSSDERIVEFHDLTTIDLEAELATGGEFELLAAELFLLRAHQADTPYNCPVFKPEKLHDARHLEYRLSKQYREQVLRCVREILPSPSATDISKGVVADAPLRKRLTDMIQKGLALQGLEGEVQAADLIDDKYPQASIVLGAVLNRRSQAKSDIVGAYRKAIDAGPSDTDPFFKVGGWIDNNLYGSLFYLYAGLPRRPNVMYAGFDRFCMLADPNLRFFQALCHAALLLAFERTNGKDMQGQLRVDVDVQAKAARQVSDKIYQDILQLGSHGVDLLEVAGRLGRLFQAFNRRRSQSEPEVNHFSIDHAERHQLSPQAERILREAKIWSVLYEETDTKNKSDYDIAQTDLILNPIYAPHFSISYRKRRKVTLSASHTDVLLSKSAQHYEAVLKELVNFGDQDPGQAEDRPGLFGQGRL
ncbi:MAG: hypothetical protein HZC37_25495 [Burkholderiales bacterium]|nr:hypothetical protein [Burkholderiales bacterium]